MSKFLFISILLFIYACGGGGSSSLDTETPNSTSTLLPGSVNSFQPLDIDDWLWKEFLFYY